MLWKQPPLIKIYEALGALADGRIKVAGDHAEVLSSSRNKTYQVDFDPETNTIVANDNGSYWQGYLGYPAIAFLFATGKIEFNEEMAGSLKGIKWKELNTQFKNDYDKTIQHIYGSIADPKVLNELETEIDRIQSQISGLNLKRPAKIPKPPGTSQ